MVLLLAILRVTLNPWKNMTVKKTKTVPRTLLRLGNESLKKASWIDPSLFYLNKVP